MLLMYANSKICSPNFENSNSNPIQLIGEHFEFVEIHAKEFPTCKELTRKPKIL